jgi:CubicO group peptidase (beta-lactamase class C family)
MPDLPAELEAELKALPTTSFLVMAGGEIIWQYGDITHASYLASARKSVLSVLFGRPVSEGLIPLDRTVGELGIDDVGGLLPIERTATVRDLLTSRSGVYHPAATLSGGEAGFPPRGSVAPGQVFHYNNWDFNVLGSIYELCTGRSVFDGLRDELAGPLGFQDFDPGRQRLLGRPERSRHLAYHFYLSARDLARVGLLVLRRGQWAQRRLVPAEWLAESTSVQVELAPMDYGYLWWLPRVRRPGAFLALGTFGQYLLGLPELDLVVVHRVALADETAAAHSSRADGDPGAQVAGVGVEEFLAIARKVTAGMGR